MKPYWKVFQDRTLHQIQEVCNRHAWFFHAFSDTRVAGGMMRSQPGEAFVLTPGMAWLIECKSSTKYKTLASGFSTLMKKTQAAKHLQWNRAGHKSLILFYSTLKDPLGDVEIYDGYEASELRATGKRLALPFALSRQSLCGSSFEKLVLAEKYNEF